MITIEQHKGVNVLRGDYAKECAKISVEIEYHTSREIIFNLRACRVIENEKVYLARVQELIDLEKQVKQEIEKL